MAHSYITEDVESFYFMIGLLVNAGFNLDFDYMRNYIECHPGQFLILIKED